MILPRQNLIFKSLYLLINMTDDPFKNALKLLVQSYHLVSVEGKLVITEKFHRELAEVSPTELYETMGNHILPVKDSYLVTGTLPKSTKKMVLSSPGDKLLFAEFILRCEVPAKVYLQGGSFYWANKYSKEADLEFQKILAKGYRLDILMAATKLYYKAGGAMEAITNYITRGTWITHYNAMEENLKNGTIQEHIKASIDDHSNSIDR